MIKSHIKTRVDKLEELLKGCPACAQRDRELASAQSVEDYLEMYFAFCPKCHKRKTFAELVLSMQPEQQLRQVDFNFNPEVSE